MNFDRALLTLREEVPSPEATARLRATLSSLPLGRGRGGASRRRLARPLAITMITAALSLVVFFPRAKTGSAWAQTLAAIAEAPNVHTVSRFPNGRLGLEEWRSGVKNATVLYTDEGSVQSEMRGDGERAVTYFNWSKVAESRHEKRSPNARSFAVVSKDSRPGRPFYEIPLGGVEVALNDSDVKVVGHTEATGDQPEVYRLRHTVRLGGKPVGKPREITAEIDPESRRIRALVEAPRRFKGRVVTIRTEIDYPAIIPSSVFAPKVQVAKVDATYDLDAINGAVQRTLRNGLGKQGPVTLRSVLLDGEGTLWAYWTGAPTTRTFATPGIPLKAGGDRNAYSSGLTGLARTPKLKIGDRLDLDISYLGGVARFKAVPVRRIGLIQNVQGVLMAFR